MLPSLPHLVVYIALCIGKVNSDNSMRFMNRIIIVDVSKYGYLAALSSRRTGSNSDFITNKYVAVIKTKPAVAKNAPDRFV